MFSAAVRVVFYYSSTAPLMLGVSLLLLIRRILNPGGATVTERGVPRRNMTVAEMTTHGLVPLRFDC